MRSPLLLLSNMGTALFLLPGSIIWGAGAEATPCEALGSLLLGLVVWGTGAEATPREALGSLLLAIKRGGATPYKTR